MPGSALRRTLRSAVVAAFLAPALTGCGNAQVGARESTVADTTVQDWVTEPPLWTPRPILIPLASRPVAVPDSAADSLKRDSTVSDSAADTTRVALVAADSGKRASPVKAKKRIFNISPADSARWPVRAPDPLPGSILPEHRIVAFYGNPLSKRMGILGEIAPDEMLRRLETTATAWAAADSGQKVLPALHLIATVAQGYPGPARKYRLQMPDSIIERVANWVETRGWLLILDIQPGLSTVEAELPALVPFLKRPYVHLALDPEFAMKDGHLPGRDWMGRMDASEVNHAIDVLAKIVEEYQLPPKVLVVHRFTRNMLTNASQIRLDPRVQVVVDMDGYGPPGSKMGAYRWFVVRHPVQYTGFKLFFKNDKPMLKPEEVLELYPRPMYIQYQ
ncbi:MAG: hypothetical protein QOK27_54 [Gemmatimonadales bacterium]|jgi:hypothetical protein|nr:hypothetical protein [Gemmatimonadales bacterium]